MSTVIEDQDYATAIGNLPQTLIGAKAAAQTDEKTWEVAFEDGVAAIELLDSPPRLAFARLLGIPPVERRMNVFETLLSWNALRVESGGSTFGLGGADGEIMLVQEWSAGADGMSGLPEALNQFWDTSEQWAGFILAEPGENAGQHQLAISNGLA